MGLPHASHELLRVFMWAVCVFKCVYGPVCVCVWGWGSMLLKLKLLHVKGLSLVTAQVYDTIGLVSEAPRANQPEHPRL